MRDQRAAKPPLEVLRRLEELRAKTGGLTLHGESLRVFRALEVLERIGTAQARDVLQGIAGGAAEARLTREAQDCLRRLKTVPAK